MAPSDCEKDLLLELFSNIAIFRAQWRTRASRASIAMIDAYASSSAGIEERGMMSIDEFGGNMTFAASTN